jgi:tape measure domain-containing protein
MEENLKYRISLEDLFSKPIQGADHNAKRFEHSVDSLGDHLNELKNQAIAAMGVFQLFEFGKDIIETTKEFEGFTNVIKYASTDTKDAAANLNYVEDAIKRLHLPMKETYQAFSEMEAGFYGTGVEGEKLRKVFEGIATASTVLHLSADKFSHVTFALKEIGELGTLQARQLRMLAFALPGAMNIAAKAMHMTSEQLHEAMKKGEVKSSVFLPAFAAAAQEHFQPGLANASKSLQAHLNDLSTKFEKFKLAIGRTSEDLMKEFADALMTTIDLLMKVGHWLKENGEFLLNMTEIIGGSIIAYKTIEGAIMAVKGAQLLLNMAMEANPWGLVITSILAAIVAIKELVQQYDKLKDQYVKDDLNTYKDSFKEQTEEIDKQAQAWEKLSGKKKEANMSQFIDQKIADLKKSGEVIEGFFKSIDPKTEEGAHEYHKRMMQLNAVKGKIDALNDYSKQAASKSANDDLGSGLSEAKESKIKTITININQPFKDQRVTMGGGNLNPGAMAQGFAEFLISLTQDAAIVAAE